MASDLTAYLGNKLLRWLNGNAMPTAPTALYVALFDGNPKTTGTEVTTTISAAGRIATAFTTIASGTTHAMSNTGAADFGDSDGACSLSHLGIFDASTAGNLLASKAMAGGPLAIGVGTGVTFEIGDITFNIGSDT